MKKIKTVGVLFCAILLLQGCFNVNNGYENELSGKILWPASNEKGNVNIYYVNTTENLALQKLYYKNSNYSKLYYPSKMSDAILLVGTKKSKSEHEIVKILEGKAETLLVKKDEILYPTTGDDVNIVYIGKNKDKVYLGCYSNDSKIDNKLFIGNIDVESRPAVSPDGRILFVKKKNEEYIISSIDKRGNEKDIIKGHYPVWLNDNRTFIYYYDNSLRQYDLESNKSKIIKKNITVTGTPVVGPNKKFIAIFERDSVSLFGGESIDYLRIISLNDGKKIDVKAYLDAGYIYNWGGLEWIK